LEGWGKRNVAVELADLLSKATTGEYEEDQNNTHVFLRDFITQNGINFTTKITNAEVRNIYGMMMIHSPCSSRSSSNSSGR